ncbi:unnamed protein product [Brassica rapa]|uniref:AAA-type ATPase N-terminal domain-containing protein n=2 Tax=Brassica TaxID=3705 RepID=A0A3P5YYI5_BRACM|nr:unnamed protein product [Brassica napus]CAG7872576.1 unnamed protein product [Brassica rapa]VDC68425.1 unnamed protein product [Brassica rapa]
MRETGGVWGLTGSTMTSLMFLWAIYKQFFPYQLRVLIEKYVYKLMKWVSTSVHIKFNEYTGLKKIEAYNSIRNYLSSKSTAHAKRLKANEKKGSKSLVLSLADHEAVEDVFNGVNVKWSSHVSKREDHSNASAGSEERRYFTLSFHMQHREMIIESYLDHVLREGRKIEFKNRERKLYTNNKSHGWSFKEGKWCSVPFHHPATFETLAMDPVKKEGIKKDLSTMISAVANFLEYDVYDLELTTVKDNSDLKRLLLDTKRKSIIVIEDIDCSLGVTGQKRKKEEDEDQEEEDDEGKKKKASSEKAFYEERERSRVTLSGLLNAIDGLWSACSDEKIMVFTTNFVENLDPALIRRGRMDNHIEMGYCRFEAFKVLAKNYLEIEWHELYGEIERLVEEIDMSPADVAENLMPKSDEEDAEVCLRRLVKSLEEERENSRKLAEEEEKKKAELEARRKKKMKKKADLEVKEKAAD